MVAKDFENRPSMTASNARKYPGAAADDSDFTLRDIGRWVLAEAARRAMSDGATASGASENAAQPTRPAHTLNCDQLSKNDGHAQGGAT